MNTINVIDNKGVLTADLSVSKELWSAILRDGNIATDNALYALFAFYFFPDRDGSCTDAADKYGRNVKFFNNNVWNFGKKAAEKFNIKVIGTDGTESYWIVPMGKGYNGKDGKFHWQLRSELAEAMQDFLLEKAMQQYTANFDSSVPGIDSSDWSREGYKWENLRTFKDNWDVNAMNFAEMLKASLAKTGNLMTSMNNYPKKMLLEISKDDPEFARSIFKVLFDETRELKERITEFCDKAEEWVHIHRGENLTSYQDTNSTSTLLWLRYPEKYYIYKYGELKKIATKLGIANPPKANGTVESMLRGFELFNQFNALVVNNTAICQKLDEIIAGDPDKYYNDSTYHTLTQDFGFWIGRYFKGFMEQSGSGDKDNSDLPEDQIIKVTFSDGYVIFEQNARTTYIETLRRIGLSNLIDIPSHHTHYGLKAVSSTKWPDSVDTGKYKFIDGAYVYVHYKSAWLKENLDTYSKNLNLGLTVELVDKSSWNSDSAVTDEIISSNEQDVCYWWLVASPKYWSFAALGVGETECYTVKNENGNRRRIPANFDAAKEGDIVIGYEANPVKSIVALAVVSRASDGETIEFKKTESLNTPIEWADFKDLPELSEMEFIKNKNGSLFKLTPEEYDAIMELIRAENPLPKVDPVIEPYDKEKFLDEVFMTPEDFDRLSALLRYKKNIILQGAPGVGKTFSAKRLAYAVMGEKDASRVEVVQFHQNYSYEDFIMGYKPDENGFKLKKGLFYEFCYRARNDRSRPYFFIIDEINRGNLSRIFGELLQLIENGYRDKPLRLAYNGEEFSVPANLHIIGMMNTADRSLAMIDYALRRRFSFFTMRPGFNTDGFRKHVSEYADDYFNRVIAEIVDLNNRISNDDSLGEGFCIGHSYFCNNPDVKNVLDFDIKPMIEEYWFDDKNKRETALSRIDDLLK